ncbi:MAG: DUF4124 domain-containing protein [Comamonas sp.]|jgi:hypothetical protein|nr:DUF4124 domain-containing protein [Comamonas sp.]
MPISTKSYKLLFLMSLVGASMLHSAQATNIYQCKQPNGQVAFQQVPCAHSDAQTQIRQTPNTSAAPPTTTPQPAAKTAAPAPGKAEISMAGTSDRQACNDAGVAVLERKLSHPQAVYQACKKELPGRQTDQACMEACLQTWLRGYEKSLKSQ